MLGWCCLFVVAGIRFFVLGYVLFLCLLFCWCVFGAAFVGKWLHMRVSGGR